MNNGEVFKVVQNWRGRRYSVNPCLGAFAVNRRQGLLAVYEPGVATLPPRKTHPLFAFETELQASEYADWMRADMTEHVTVEVWRADATNVRNALDVVNDATRWITPDDIIAGTLFCDTITLKELLPL